MRKGEKTPSSDFYLHEGQIHVDFAKMPCASLVPSHSLCMISLPLTLLIFSSCLHTKVLSWRMGGQSHVFWKWEGALEKIHMHI